jgi:hypothetical protein
LTCSHIFKASFKFFEKTRKYLKEVEDKVIYNTTQVNQVGIKESKEMGKSSNDKCKREGKKAKSEVAFSTALKVGKRIRYSTASNHSTVQTRTIARSVGGWNKSLLRQSFAIHGVRLRCKVCLKIFASEYYLTLHKDKVQCKKKLISLTSGVEYIAVDKEVYNNFYVPWDPPEILSRNTTHIYVFLHVYTCSFS